jgi:hypothetical protein
MAATRTTQQSTALNMVRSAHERTAFSVAEFCFRNDISRPTYQRLRSQGRGPVEMRLGLNTVRITAESERAWQHLMQQPNPKLEQQAVARAVKAGDAAAKSPAHVSKQGRRIGRGRLQDHRSES